jgi:hypothetical protein
MGRAGAAAGPATAGDPLNARERLAAPRESGDALARANDIPAPGTPSSHAFDGRNGAPSLSAGRRAFGQKGEINAQGYARPPG